MTKTIEEWASKIGQELKAGRSGVECIIRNLELPVSPEDLGDALTGWAEVVIHPTVWAVTEGVRRTFTVDVFIDDGHCSSAPVKSKDLMSCIAEGMEPPLGDPLRRKQDYINRLRRLKKEVDDLITALS